jgi:hypothetical protein
MFLPATRNCAEKGKDLEGTLGSQNERTLDSLGAGNRYQGYQRVTV